MAMVHEPALAEPGPDPSPSMWRDRSSIDRWIRAGVLAELVVGATTIAMAIAWGLPVLAVLLLIGVVVLWRVHGLVTLPAFERVRSLTPATRLIQAFGAVAGLLVVAGLASAPAVQRSAIVLVSAAAVAAAAAAMHRVALGRAPVVLIGSDAAMTGLLGRWAGRDDVDVVQTCRWAEVDGPVQDPAELVVDVLAAVDRVGIPPVVLVGAPASSPVVSQLVPVLRQARIECVIDIDRRGSGPSAGVRHSRDRRAAGLVKSAIDRVGAAVGLVLLSPVLVVIAAGVRLDSRGPAVFSQVRTGQDGRQFRMYKFRSMVLDAESRLDDLADRNEASGPLFKIVQDPRITRFGRFLRRSSLDELLQLVNVVKGEMSLVGPRPALPSETATYDRWTHRRLHVKPGLTGLWQVSGRSSLTWEDALRMDLEYVDNQSLLLDLSIVLRTFGAVARSDGAH